MSRWVLAAALILCAFGWAQAEDGKSKEKKKRLTIEERVTELESLLLDNTHSQMLLSRDLTVLGGNMLSNMKTFTAIGRETTKTLTALAARIESLENR